MRCSIRLRSWCLSVFVVVAVCGTTLLSVRGSRIEECSSYRLVEAAEKGGCFYRVKSLIRDGANLDAQGSFLRLDRSI